MLMLEEESGEESEEQTEESIAEDPSPAKRIYASSVDHPASFFMQAALVGPFQSEAQHPSCLSVAEEEIDKEGEAPQAKRQKKLSLLVS